MKYRLLYHFLFLFCVVTVSAQSMYESRVSGSSRPVWQQTDPNEAYYLKNRRALTGTGCCVNRMTSTVGLVDHISNLGYLLDDDLDNAATFAAVGDINLTGPIIGVKDIENSYAAGTTAGFCIAISNYSTLNLDLLNGLVGELGISFYYQGEPVTADEGSSDESNNNLLGLSLLNLSDGTPCLYLTATATDMFDEVCLTTKGLADINLINAMQIRYAFVGNSKEIKLTTAGVQEYFGDGADIEVDGRKVIQVAVTIPKDFDGDDKEAIKNGEEVTLIGGLGLLGGISPYLQIELNNEDYYFEKGSEVGFNIKSKGLASVGLLNLKGTKISILNLEGSWKEVSSQNNLLGLSLLENSSQIIKVKANEDIRGVKIELPSSIIDVDLGATYFLGASVSEPVDAIHQCPINPTMNTNICDDEETYTLKADMSVTWSVASQPDGANVTLSPSEGGTECQVSDMTIPGEYEFAATAPDGCVEYVTIKKGNLFEGETECGTGLVNIDGETPDYELSTDIYETSGSLITINDIDNKENILNANIDDYAEYIGGISIANDLRIIGVKKTGGGMISDGTTAIRAGFVVEFQSTGLSLDLLEFFQIRLYNKGQKVLSIPIDNSDVLGVGLIGSEKTQKVRFSVNVPAGTKFDEMMLWRSGILNLNLSNLKIYYPFIEEETDNCGDPLGCSTTVVSAGTIGAHWNADATFTAGVASVFSTINNMSNFVDDDMDTYMSLIQVLGADGKVFAVNMGRNMEANHQLGIVIDKTTYLAGVGLIDWLTVETFKNGESTEETFSDWKVLGVNAIGYGDKSILLMTPKQEYDEVRITVAGVSALGDNAILKFYGMFVRSDIDGDGIPDCKDPQSCGIMVDNVTSDRICEGNDLNITLQVSNVTAETDISLIFADSSPLNGTVTVTSNGKETYKLTGEQTKDQAGRYLLSVKAGEKLLKQINLDIHPLQTEWKTGATSTNWNNWDNWTRGVPFCCTDVVIPSGASCYPVLSYSLSNPSCCNNIHFEPGAQVVNSPELAYRKAWVEAEFNPNRYYLFSAPLKEMVTGDMFVPAAMNGVHTADKFTELDETTSPENRFNPSVFQRVWQSAVDGKVLASSWNLSQNDLTDTQLNVLEGEWSRNFNAVAHSYKAGNAVSVWVDNGELPENTLFRFRFPKKHTLYHYYSDIDQTELGEEVVSRNTDNIGRFIYETESKETPFTAYSGSQKWNWSEEPGPGTGLITQCLDVVVEKDADATYSNTFLVGNPFLSYVNIEKFLEENADKVSEVRLYNGNTTEAVVAAADGSFITNATSQATTGMIAPMEGFYVRAREGRTSESGGKETLVLRFTPLMLEQKNEDQATMDGQETSSELMRLNVYSADYRSSMVIAPAEKGAKSELLLDGEVTPALALFAADQDQACDVLSTDADVVPLGFMTAHAETVTLSATGNTEGWLIRDRISGKTKSVAEEIKIKVDGTSVGRYELVRNQDQIDSDHTAAVIVSSRNGRIHILSPDSEIRKVIVYDLNGQNLCNRQVSGNEVELTTLGGIRIVEVFLESGKSFRTKILD